MPGRPIQLKPRLMALALRVPPGSCVADIGTDHARVPLYLLQQGITDRVIATDVREGPLKMAAAALSRHGLLEKAVLRLGKGADCLEPDEANCVIIAGMGGDTIADILIRSPWLREKRLLLQPQTHSERVLSVLEEWGKVPNTLEVREKGRTYIVIEC